MEQSPRKKVGTHRLRPLNAPAALQVKVDGGVPQALMWRSHWRSVEHVDEIWRVDDGWWRAAPTARTYFRLALDGGHVVTLFRDEIGGGWWEQRY
jgi:hypothetical protein